MIIQGDGLHVIFDLQCYLGKPFKIKDLGLLNNFFGLEISSRIVGYYLSPSKYASNLLTRSGITNSVISSTSLESSVCLTFFNGVLLNDATLYQKVVDNLIYLTMTHQDTTYVIYVVSL